jgi:hypothetical protein
MLVYGDGERREDPRALLDRIACALAALPDLPAGIARHQALVAAFIEMGELAQGIADAAFAARRADAPSPPQDACMAVATALAAAVRASWRDGFHAPPPSPGILAPLRVLPFPPAITVRRPEGYAFYALYPEACAEAAARLAPEPTRVVGIRSIGTGLAAMVAAALATPPPITVRPTGHPFRREIALDRALAGSIDPDVRWAVVDEGPGLSGSSFGAVADALEARGVAPERIAFFPGHGGALGPQASARHRERWARASRPFVGFDDLVLRAREPAHRLERWIADLVGGPVAPLEDVSGGAWRARRFGDEAHWPPANVAQERRKFLLRTAEGTWLVKFAGLGREGERKTERARALAEAGFSPPVAGFRHGFMVSRWCDARPLDTARDREDFVGQVAAYLGFRTRRFPAEPSRGAAAPDLLRMAQRNAALALGDGAARALGRWEERLETFRRRALPIETDNRLHAWEWLDESGRLLKTDAVDHHAGHDLVGCQDVAWDIAGAAVEFALTDAETLRLAAAVERESGRPVDEELLRFLVPCYLAFQLGSWTLAAESCGPAEAPRLRAAAARYAARLAALLA